MAKFATSENLWRGKNTRQKIIFDVLVFTTSQISDVSNIGMSKNPSFDTLILNAEHINKI